MSATADLRVKLNNKNACSKNTRFDFSSMGSNKTCQPHRAHLRRRHLDDSIAITITVNAYFTFQTLLATRKADTRRGIGDADEPNGTSNINVLT